MKSNVHHRKHTEVKKLKNSVGVCCILATVTDKTQMRNYTDIMSLLCKDGGEKTTLKCKE